MAVTFVLSRSNISRYVLDMSHLIKVFCPFFWWPNAGTQEKCLFRNIIIIIIIIYYHQYCYYCYLLSSILLLLSLFWGILLLAVLAQKFGGFSILKNTLTVFTYHSKFAPPMLHAWRLFFFVCRHFAAHPWGAYWSRALSVSLRKSTCLWWRPEAYCCLGCKSAWNF